jgi:starvation-inducible DNA-binding protein
MDELKIAMQRALADTFLMYIKTHTYHWNVMGPDFSQYHKFFGDLYEELWAAVDVIAEHIRTLDEFAMGNLINYTKIGTIDLVNDELNPFPAEAMFMQLTVDNEKVIKSLMAAHALAEEANNRGIVNFLEDRLDTHAKHGWMLKATVRKG